MFAHHTQLELLTNRCIQWCASGAAAAATNSISNSIELGEALPLLAAGQRPEAAAAAAGGAGQALPPLPLMIVTWSATLNAAPWFLVQAQVACVAFSRSRLPWPKEGSLQAMPGGL
jgi:hypothetical protein